MITRDQFEARARAEADEASDRAAKCLSAEIYVSLPKPVSDSTSEIVDRRIRDWKDGYTNSYIAARMKHEWPLVVAMQFIGIDAREVFDHDTSLLTVKAGSGRIISHSDAALSPYTTKH